MTMDKPKYVEIHQVSASVPSGDGFTLGEGYETRTIRDGKVIEDTGIFKRIDWLEEQVERLSRELARLHKRLDEMERKLTRLTDARSRDDG